MSAETMGSFDPLLKRIFAEKILERLELPDWTTPEWRAWSKEWREEVPLTAEQERENAEWRKGVKVARERLASMVADFGAALDGIASEFGVRVSGGGEDEWEIDDYDAPHKPTYRTKDGAPPAPPMFQPVRIPTHIEWKRNE